MTTCNAVSPALEGGTCVFDSCAGRHSWQGPKPAIDKMTLHVPSGHQAQVPVWIEVDGAPLLSAAVVRLASQLSEAVELPAVPEAAVVPTVAPAAPRRRRK